MNYKYRVSITADESKIDRDTETFKGECVVCQNKISSEKSFYWVEQLPVEEVDWSCYPSKITCSDICANMLIFAALDECKSWSKRLRARWTVETAAQLKAVHGIDIENEKVI